MEQIYGGTVGSAFRTVCMDRRFAFVIGVCALAAGGYEAGKKSGKRKKEDARDVPHNNSDKDDERRKKQKQQLECRWSICVWNGRKRAALSNVRSNDGDVKESDAGKG